MLISAGILFLVSQAAHDTVPLNSISLRGWMAILYLVLFGSIIAFIAFIYSMKVLPTAISSLYAYINPLVAMIVASLVVGEKLNIHILWGGMVTLIGVFLVNLSIKRRAKMEVESEI
jgi:drug/metabolite transporter (DMT)-like permease